MKFDEDSKYQAKLKIEQTLADNGEINKILYDIIKTTIDQIKKDIDDYSSKQSKRHDPDVNLVWLINNGIKPETIANRLRCSTQYISQCRHGKAKLTDHNKLKIYSLRFMANIAIDEMRITNGNESFNFKL